MAALPHSFNPSPHRPPSAPLRRMRSGRPRRIWLEIVLTVLLLLGVGLLVRGAARAWMRMPVGATGLTSIVKPIAQLHEEFARIGNVSAAEGIAGVQQITRVADIECAGAHCPVLAQAFADR